MENKNESKEGKRKFALWIRESTLEKVRQWFEHDNCSSQSEFIEKAVLFYIGYLASEGKRTANTMRLTFFIPIFLPLFEYLSRVLIGFLLRGSSRVSG